MKRTDSPRLQIDAALVDLLVKSALLRNGIYGPKTYFQQWPIRIAVCVLLCACIGVDYGGASGLLWGALVGMVMPLALLYMGVMLPMILAQLAGLILGACWIVFCLWVIIKLLRYK